MTPHAIGSPGQTGATHLPSVRQLEIFVAVARHRSFSRASEVLHLSQSALSQSILQTEAALGGPLFERTKRSVTITAAGQQFLMRAERLLTALQDAVEEFRSGIDPSKGRIVVACMSLIATRWLPSVIGSLRHDYPDVSVTVWDDYSPRIIAAVKSGEADLGITTLFEREPGLEYEPLMEESFYFICPVGHRLAGRKIVWSDLKGEAFVGTAKGSSVRAALDRAGISSGLLQESAYEIGRVTSVVEIVAQGGGISVVPAIALEEEHLMSRICACKMTNPEVRRSIGLVKARDVQLSPIATSFRETLIRLFGSSC